MFTLLLSFTLRFGWLGLFSRSSMTHHFRYNFFSIRQKRHSKHMQMRSAIERCIVSNVSSKKQ